MNCKKCGFVSNNGEKFCRNCGSILEENNYNGGVINPNPTVNNQAPNNYSNVNNDYNKAINPNMNKWAILSVIVPAVGIIWYWFIGLSFYLAILIATCSLAFAKKGEVANKKLAIIGKILSGVLIGMTIIMFILYCIGLV